MLNENTKLIGKLIQLEPLQEIHRDTLRQVSSDDKISAYSPALKLKFDSWFDKALKKISDAGQFSFVVRNLRNDKIVGSTRFYDIYFDHKRLAIGYTWYTPDMWGTGINLDCKLLLLNCAFEELKMNRIEFFIDSRNERSRFAVKKLGATEEGMLRQHIILDDGFIRDTVVYSILKNEWPLLLAKLQEKLKNYA